MLLSHKCNESLKVRQLVHSKCNAISNFLIWRCQCNLSFAHLVTLFVFPFRLRIVGEINPPTPAKIHTIPERPITTSGTRYWRRSPPTNAPSGAAAVVKARRVPKTCPLLEGSISRCNNEASIGTYGAQEHAPRARHRSARDNEWKIISGQRKPPHRIAISGWLNPGRNRAATTLVNNAPISAPTPKPVQGKPYPWTPTFRILSL